jgi:4-diphosphocytidyl-2-C-methyl-D-erythritol kinase
MTLDQGEDRGSFGSRGSSHLDALRDSAPAKINLTLEVKGKRADGYHELESLVLFADFGDELEYRPAADFSLTVDGPFSDGLAGGDNLVQRAASAYAERYGQRLSGRFRLRKQLPVAAGLGGGSSDAAATLRILRKLHGVPGDLTALVPLARDLGADIPCCLHARAAIMTGIGETLHPLPASERIPALLVNAMRPLATADVFRELVGTRGVTMSLATFNAADDTMTWLAIGNVEGVLLRADPRSSRPMESILMRAGVVGLDLPRLQASVTTISAGDLVVLATDGIRRSFVDLIYPADQPQALAERVLRFHAKGTDDALVLVARYRGSEGPP